MTGGLSMKGQRRIALTMLPFGWVLILCGLVACSSVSSPNLELSVKDQEVPIVIAIGPMDITNVRLDDDRPVPKVDSMIQQTFQDSLKRAGVFKEVKILQLDTEADKKADPEKILGLAREQHADLLLMGDNKEFEGRI